MLFRIAALEHFRIALDYFAAVKWLRPTVIPEMLTQPRVRAGMAGKRETRA